MVNGMSGGGNITQELGFFSSQMSQKNIPFVKHCPCSLIIPTTHLIMSFTIRFQAKIIEISVKIPFLLKIIAFLILLKTFEKMEL